MKLFIPILATLLTTASPGLAKTQGIPQTLLDKFMQVAQICMSIPLQGQCANPGGLTILTTITSPVVDIYAWVLRDDANQELNLVFRGTASEANIQSDTNTTLAPFDTLPCCIGCMVHGGYYQLWAAVADNITAIMQGYHAEYPDYNIILTGHSLGGGLVSLAAAQFYSVFDNLTAYSLGQPRTGNPAYAKFIDTLYTTSSLETTKFYRCTHENDGVPNAVPASLGYQHHGLEFWNLDPTSAENTWVCGGETTECNGGTNGTGVNAAHLTYWNYTVVSDAKCSP